MLVGEHEHTIDDKNRLTLPAKFRQAFADGLVLTRGIERCLYAYPRSEWAATVESRLRELDPLSKEGRLIRRYFFSGQAGRGWTSRARGRGRRRWASQPGRGRGSAGAGFTAHSRTGTALRGARTWTR